MLYLALLSALLTLSAYVWYMVVAAKQLHRSLLLPSTFSEQANYMLGSVGGALQSALPFMLALLFFGLFVFFAAIQWYVDQELHSYIIKTFYSLVFIVVLFQGLFMIYTAQVKGVSVSAVFMEYFSGQRVKNITLDTNVPIESTYLADSLFSHSSEAVYKLAQMIEQGEVITLGDTEGIDVNAYYSHEEGDTMTFLALALQSQNPLAAEVLLRAGADPHQPLSNNNTSTYFHALLDPFRYFGNLRSLPNLTLAEKENNEIYTNAQEEIIADFITAYTHAGGNPNVLFKNGSAGESINGQWVENEILALLSVQLAEARLYKPLMTLIQEGADPWKLQPKVRAGSFQQLQSVVSVLASQRAYQVLHTLIDQGYMKNRQDSELESLQDIVRSYENSYGYDASAAEVLINRLESEK